MRGAVGAVSVAWARAEGLDRVRCPCACTVGAPEFSRARRSAAVRERELYVRPFLSGNKEGREGQRLELGHRSALSGEWSVV